jgi:hypothetical protein
MDNSHYYVVISDLYSFKRGTFVEVITYYNNICLVSNLTDTQRENIPKYDLRKIKLEDGFSKSSLSVSL